MEVLRGVFESLGYTAVETLIASGNVIFEAPAGVTPQAAERTIETALEGALGFEVTTFLRTPAELAEIVAYEPFSATGSAPAGGSLYVGFLHAPPAAERVTKLLALRSTTDDFKVHGREFYWLAARGTGTSKISNSAIERALGAPATMRNITTVKKLAGKYPASRQ